MVAEKPSIAKSISEILSHGKYELNNKGKVPVYTFSGIFKNQNVEFIVCDIFISLNRQLLLLGIYLVLILIQNTKTGMLQTLLNYIQRLQFRRKHLQVLMV